MKKMRLKIRTENEIPTTSLSSGCGCSKPNIKSNPEIIENKNKKIINKLQDRKIFL